MIVADRVQLHQELMNLMPNGIEAMKDTGGVLMERSQFGEGGQIQTFIHDTGPGLPLGKVDQIFDAFFTTKPQGGGMGLAISKSIVESQGGRIGADGCRWHSTSTCPRLPRKRALLWKPHDSAFSREDREASRCQLMHKRVSNRGVASSFCSAGSRAKGGQNQR
jgi:signal transduction histidine kinase